MKRIRKIRTPRADGLRRRALLASAALTVAAGLLVRFIGSGIWTNHTGDALYAVLIYLLMAAVAPRIPSVLISAAALAVCTAVELLQLSPLPAALGEIFPPARLVFGTTFGMLDLVSYGTGVLAAGLLDRVLRRRLGVRRPRSRNRSGTVPAEASARTCRR